MSNTKATKEQLSDPLQIPLYQGDNPPPFEDERENGQTRFIAPNIIMVRQTGGSGTRVQGVRKFVFFNGGSDLELEAFTRICQKETRIMQAARHPHAILCHAAYFHKPKYGYMNFNIIMDHAEKGDLSNCLSKSPELLQGRWIGCLIRVVAHIHRLGIRHRDIKPPNVLINANNELMLADFGISHMSLGVTVPTTNPGWNKSRTTTYCAPEVNQAEGRSRGRSADIFSLGAVLVEMLLSHSYGKDYQDLLEVTKDPSRSSERSFANTLDEVHGLLADFETGKRKTKQQWHSDLFSLCRKMLHKDRDERPLAEAAVKIWDHLLPPADGTKDAAASRQLSCDTCTSSIPNKNKTDELLEACKAGNSTEIEKLLGGDDKPSPNTEGAIHQAVMIGSEASVDILIKKGANINTPDYAGQTALHYAAASGNDKLVKKLLGYKGVKVTAVDLELQTPLHCAAARGSVVIINLLLNALDKPKRKGGGGGGGDAQKMGRDHPINALDDDGLAPLHYAARMNRLDAVKLLLKRGADSQVRSKRGQFLAADLAYNKEYYEVANVLENAEKHGLTQMMGEYCAVV